jgi:hypothetical protein
VFDWKACLELIIALGAIAAMWIRLEHRLTQVESSVKERYRDKRDVSDRIGKIERWLPKEHSQEPTE